jgi:hypothetical protein
LVIRNVFAKTDVSFRDQIKQRQTKVNIIACDGYDEAQVRVNHPFASCCIAVPDSAPEFDFFIGRQWDICSASRRIAHAWSKISGGRRKILVNPRGASMKS